MERVIGHWADDRPAWLWSADGDSLLWRNDSARLFRGRIKKSGLKLGHEPAPIKGQVARLIRLGSTGRSSLSRVQFLAGDRAISATCACTPLRLDDGAMALLVVGVDAIAPELLELRDAVSNEIGSAAILPDGSQYLLLDSSGEISDGSELALEQLAPALESQGAEAIAKGELVLDGERFAVRAITASPQGATLLLFEAEAETTVSTQTVESVRAEEGLDIHAPRRSSAEDIPESATDREAATEPLPVVTIADPGPSADVDDEPVEVPSVAEAEPESTFEPETIPFPAPAAGQFTAETDDEIAAIIAFADDDDAEPEQEPAPAPTESAETDEPIEKPDAEESAPLLYRVVGRGFTPLPKHDEPETQRAAPLTGTAPNTASESEEYADDQSIRHNFDELSRILTDRVGVQQPSSPVTSGEVDRNASAQPAPEGALINLNGDTFILNRLPLGIMVLRDEQIVFANRAIVEMTGYESAESLRSGGLEAVFFDEPNAGQGPVYRLVHKDGTQLPVNARLQSVTWQGRPALLLSASAAEQRFSHEAAVRSFAELAAQSRGEGFIATDRNGVVTVVSDAGKPLLGTEPVVGRPLSTLLDETGRAALRFFLDQPARFAETVRPSVVLNLSGGAELILFAEGQAGIVAGYFGFLRAPGKPAEPKAFEGEPADVGMLGRISRGVRGPLNTIIGFADIIRSSAFGTIDNQRYLEYARDIRTAGQEIAVLVDELDDYARLKDGRYPSRPADLDLAALLESCVQRVKGQAGLARVLVRSAISERLPRIRADRASLGQAVLNLLASAIDQTPVGGTVVMSAQLEDDGSIAVNVRDTGATSVDPSDRFVVFRDGTGRDGEALAPVRSGVGLALTRSLLAVNSATLSVAPTPGTGTLFLIVIPPDLVASVAE